MIHDELVTYEVAKLAKEKGFDVPTDFCYEQNGRLVRCGSIAAPTQSLLQRWLREKKRVVFDTSPLQEMDCEYLEWCVTIYQVDKNGYGLSWKEELFYDTYEHALEEALKYALENLV